LAKLGLPALPSLFLIAALDFNVYGKLLAKPGRFACKCKNPEMIN